MYIGGNQYSNLQDSFPEIAKEWHPTKNGTLTPRDVSKASHMKVWWLCGKNHSYQQSINNKTSQNQSCPYCAGKKACIDNSLAQLFPDIAKQWHSTKNGQLTPNDVTTGSNKLVWWLCMRGHDYQAACYTRVKGTGCPFCTGKKVCHDNSLAAFSPEIASQWHPIKNGELTPHDVTKGSSRKAWWLCPKDHVFYSSISDRTRKDGATGCPYCSGNKVCIDNCLATLFPEIAQEWHPKKNGTLTPNDLTKFNTKKIWWCCPKKHSYLTSCASRVNGTNCPYCSGRLACIENCLASVAPEVAKEWHPIKNTKLTPWDVTSRTATKYWWLCKYNHSYMASVFDRTRKEGATGCPYCSGRKVCDDNSLAILYPKIAKEWHPTKNGKLTPYDVTKGSNKNVWWMCSKKHTYNQQISSRTLQNQSCPYCVGRKACHDNSLAILDPEIAREWHPTSNGILTPDDVTTGSKKQIYWICPKKHTYSAAIYDRTRMDGATGCPYCAGKKVCSDNSLAQLYPEVAKEWHPTKNGELTPHKVTKGSSKKIWWLCPRGHEYDAICSTRTNGSGCPYCSSQTSKPELRILTELMYIFPIIQSRAKIARQEIDIFLPEYKIGFEYDGYYFHKGKEFRDLKKNSLLSQQNIELIRIREKPLSKLGSCDVLITNKLRKNDINILLVNLLDKFDISIIDEINNYISKKDFQNEKKFREYLSYYPSPLLEQSLTSKCPDLALEWDLEKNHPLRPDNFSIGSNVSVYWICNRGHSFKKTIYSRVKGVGCPYCANRKVCLDNSLALLAPALALEWHPTKNNGLTPEQLTIKSSKKVWWLCPIKHEYEASCFHRRKGGGCPFCAGKKACSDNSLAVLFPKLANEWHSTKNGELTPHDVTIGSQKKIWWLCPRGHEYDAICYTRTKGSCCPFCSGNKVSYDNCLANIAPEIAKEWHPIKNYGLTPKDVSKSSHKKVWWLCTKNHEYLTSCASRTRGTGCPFCSGKKVNYDNCLANLVPEIAKEWHPTKNLGLTAMDVTRTSHKKIWWVCSMNHEYSATCASRFHGGNCPFCSGRKVNHDNCLATLAPKIAKEWHPIKNGSLTPKEVTVGSNQKVWWLCPKQHVYLAIINNRTKSIKPTGCPYCSGNKVCNDNCLANLFPELAKEWHPTKNAELTSHNVTSGSNKKIWWLCPQGHEYLKVVNKRTISRQNCPYCRKLTNKLHH